MDNKSEQPIVLLQAADENGLGRAKSGIEVVPTRSELDALLVGLNLKRSGSGQGF